MTGPESLPGEEWRDVPGYEGQYQASTLGRIWSVPCGRANGELVRSRSAHQGYEAVVLEKVRWRVHSVVMLTFVGPLPQGMVTRHLNGEPSDNRLSNLTYGTPTENALDAVRHGRNVNANKTECHRGHPFDESNTIARAGGRRECRQCRLIHNRTKAANRRRRRAEEKAARKPRTHCPNGHEMTPQNTILRPDRPGRRECRECLNIRQRKWKKSRRGAAEVAA